MRIFNYEDKMHFVGRPAPSNSNNGNGAQETANEFGDVTARTTPEKASWIELQSGYLYEVEYADFEEDPYYSVATENTVLVVAQDLSHAVAMAEDYLGTPFVKVTRVQELDRNVLLQADLADLCEAAGA